MTTLMNGAGDQTVTGSVGDDLIALGAGSDTLTGAGGVDRFVVSGKIGTDTITDFGSTDLLFFYGVFADNAALTAASTVVGGDLVINWTVDGEAQQLTLVGVTSASGIRLVPGSTGGPGTSGDDTRIGTDGYNNFTYDIRSYWLAPDEGGPNGNDLLFGLGGDDRLRTSLGSDCDPTGSIAYGGAGDDLIVVNGYAFGEAGDDILMEQDQAYGYEPEGGDLNQYTIYYGGVASLFGGEGHDVLTGGTYLDGGSGDDIVTATRTTAVAIGGDGYDRLTVANGYNFALATGFEDIVSVGTVLLADSTGATGGALKVTASTIDGSAETDAVLILIGGNLTGGALGDTLKGTAGADVMAGGTGDDIYYVGASGDQIIELSGGGSDQVRSTISLTLASNVEKLTLSGTTAINGTGNALDNALVGNSGANILNGLAGADTMKGLADNDIYYVDNLGDRVVEAADEGFDVVRSTVDFTLGANVEKLQMGGLAYAGTGNALGNTIVGNAADNRITGGLGRDVMTGGAGLDNFDFNGIADSTVAASDVITDLAFNDVIDLTDIDADTTAGGNQAFELVDAFSNQAGELIVSHYQATDQTFVLADVNGDGVADFRIVLLGNHEGFDNFGL